MNIVYSSQQRIQNCRTLAATDRVLEVGVARQPRDHGRGGGDVRGLRKIFSGTENIWSRPHLDARGPQRRVLADDHGAGRVPRGAAVDGDRADADAVRLHGVEVIMR